jgi:hypothetical protein
MSKQRKNAVDNSKATEVSPEVWAPAQTLYNASELFLTPADIGDAAQLLSITDEQIHVEFAECLQTIARQYWRQHLDARRPPAAWYREHVAQIQMNIEAALALLRSAKGTALSQLKFRTYQRMGRPLRGLEKTDPCSVECILDDFVATCNSCTFTATRGAPKKNDIKTAAASLRKVWIQFTGKHFPLNLSMADNRKDRAGLLANDQAPDDIFTSPGPRFVQVIMQRIDSKVSDAAIRTALRDASVNT